MPRAAASIALLAALLPGAPACDTPSTTAVLENAYPASAPARVVYRARWLNAAFSDPVPPGASSAAQVTVPASGATAYVVLAPGWDPASATFPASLVLLQSRDAYALHWDDTLHIVVDDARFAGDCAAGDPLTQAQADAIRTLVFPSDLSAYRYDAATCTATYLGDGGP